MTALAAVEGQRRVINNMKIIKIEYDDESAVEFLADVYLEWGITADDMKQIYLDLRKDNPCLPIRECMLNALIVGNQRIREEARYRQTGHDKDNKIRLDLEASSYWETMVGYTKRGNNGA